MSDTNNRSEFLWNVHTYLNEYIRHADTKANAVIGWTSALMGLLVAGQFHDKFGCSISGTARFLGFALLVCGFTTAFWAVHPRLSTTQLPGIIFWQSILAHKEKDVFVKDVGSKTPDELSEQVAGHLFDLSSIANDKFKWVGFSIYLAFAGSLLSGIMYMIG